MKIRKKAKKNYFLSFSASFTYGVFLHSHLSLGHLPMFANGIILPSILAAPFPSLPKEMGLCPWHRCHGLAR